MESLAVGLILLALSAAMIPTTVGLFYVWTAHMIEIEAFTATFWVRWIEVILWRRVHIFVQLSSTKVPRLKVGSRRRKKSATLLAISVFDKTKAATSHLDALTTYR